MTSCFIFCSLLPFEPVAILQHSQGVSIHIMTVCITGLQRKANWNIRLWNLKLIHSQRFVRKRSCYTSCTINILTSFSPRTPLKWERRAGTRCWLLIPPHRVDRFVRYECGRVSHHIFSLLGCVWIWNAFINKDEPGPGNFLHMQSCSASSSKLCLCSRGSPGGVQTKHSARKQEVSECYRRDVTDQTRLHDAEEEL